MKRYFPILLSVFTLFVCKTYGQQLVRASNIKMVATAGTKLVMTGGMTFLGTSNWVDSGEVFMYKNNATNPEGWLDSTATGVLDPTSNSNVYFNGAFRQSFYGKTRFYDLTIRNTVGDTLLSSCEVRNLLHLDTGFVFTKSGLYNDSLLVSNPATTAISSTSNYLKSWVNGRLSRTANVPTTITLLPPFAPFYLFPVGKTDSLYAYVRMAKINSNSTTWTIEYFPATPFNNLNVLYPPVEHVSKVEYWEITSNTTPAADDDAFVSLSWKGYSRVSATVGIRDSLQVAQYMIIPPQKWNFPGGGSWATGWVIGPDSLSGYVTSRTGSIAFDSAQRRFTLGTYSKYNVLPVSLVYFTAIGDGNKVRLNWEVENEQDINIYEVEKSLTAGNFTHLFTVASLHNPQSFYTGYDLNPSAGWNYYRLKITDRQGNYTYSPIRAVKFEKGGEDLLVFPNPATDLLHILLPGSYINAATLQVFGIDGKFISSMNPNTNMVQLSLKNLAAGTYLLQIIKNDGSRKTYRFVKN